MIGYWAAPLLGGVVAVDATSAGQTMISRPLVVGLLAGLLIGDPAFGFGIGALLELFAIVAVPTGGSRLNEMSIATVVAVCVAAQIPGPGQIPLAIGYALLVAEVGGFTIDRLRHWNAVRWEKIENQGMTPARLATLHWSAVGVDYLRGAVLVAILVPLGAVGLARLSTQWPVSAGANRELLLLAVAVHGGVLMRNWGGWKKRRVLAVAGLVAGVALGLWL